MKIYGMVQKDTPEKIRDFLGESGNPYGRIALDADGRASIEWGVYGAPETFVVDGKGVIRFKYVGPLTDPISFASNCCPPSKPPGPGRE